MSGEPSLPDGASSDLQAQTITSYDSQGQVWQTQEYSVDPTYGDVSSTALTTENYYDPDGQLIATSAPGGLWTKDTYNGAGWQVMQYQTDGGSGTSYGEAGSITSDVILTQSETSTTTIRISRRGFVEAASPSYANYSLGPARYDTPNAGSVDTYAQSSTANVRRAVMQGCLILTTMPYPRRSDRNP